MTITLGEFSMLDISGIKRLQFDVLVIGAGGAGKIFGWEIKPWFWRTRKFNILWGIK